MSNNFEVFFQMMSIYLYVIMITNLDFRNILNQCKTIVLKLMH
jgi:hypothetical protein